VYVNHALSPVLVAQRPHRPLMPYRRRVTIRWQSVWWGALAASVVIRDQVAIVKLLPVSSVTGADAKSASLEGCD